MSQGRGAGPACGYRARAEGRRQEGPLGTGRRWLEAEAGGLGRQLRPLLPGGSWGWTWTSPREGRAREPGSPPPACSHHRLCRHGGRHGPGWAAHRGPGNAHGPAGPSHHQVCATSAGEHSPAVSTATGEAAPAHSVADPDPQAGPGGTTHCRLRAAAGEGPWGFGVRQTSRPPAGGMGQGRGWSLWGPAAGGWASWGRGRGGDRRVPCGHVGLDGRPTGSGPHSFPSPPCTPRGLRTPRPQGEPLMARATRSPHRPPP